MREFQSCLSPTGHQSFFLRESQWILAGFSNWIISHDGVLQVLDFMNTWGLIAIGLGLILGLFTRIAAIAGAALVFLLFKQPATDWPGI